MRIFYVNKVEVRILLKRVTPVFFSLWYQNYKRKKRIKHYSGNRVICPICGLKFDKFAPYGPMENILCPNCRSLGRDRLLWKFLMNKTDLMNKNLQLLHFAPEKGFYDNFVTMPNIKYTPCDLMPWIYRYDNKKKLIKVDITNIPFEDNSFDVIICSHILEHVIDDALAISELYRVLKNDGWAIIQVPIDHDRETTYEDFTITKPKEREKAFGQHDHVRFYGKDYKNRLEKYGLKVKVVDYAKTLSLEEAQQNGINQNNFEEIYYCQK